MRAPVLGTPSGRVPVRHHNRGAPAMGPRARTRDKSPSRRLLARTWREFRPNVAIRSARIPARESLCDRKRVYPLFQSRQQICLFGMLNRGKTTQRYGKCAKTAVGNLKCCSRRCSAEVPVQVIQERSAHL